MTTYFCPRCHRPVVRVENRDALKPSIGAESVMALADSEREDLSAAMGKEIVEILVAPNWRSFGTVDANTTANLSIGCPYCPNGKVKLFTKKGVT